MAFEKPRARAQFRAVDGAQKQLYRRVYDFRDRLVNCGEVVGGPGRHRHIVKAQYSDILRHADARFLASIGGTHGQNIVTAKYGIDAPIAQQLLHKCKARLVAVCVAVNKSTELQAAFAKTLSQAKQTIFS